MSDPFDYEAFLRPNYEVAAFAAWAGSAAVAAWVGQLTGLPPEPFWLFAAAAAAMAAFRGRGALANRARRSRLRGKPVAFTDHRRIAAWVKRHPDRIWLGWGFEWTAAHLQRAQEILNEDLSRFVPTGPHDTGAHWIHALERRERPVTLPVDLTKGHTLIAGTTRAGKSVMFRSLISQCIARGEAVVIVDPKGDPDMKEETRLACAAHGKRFLFVHPAFPSESARINLLRNFTRGTDLAGRIASIIPSESGADPFVAFGHMALNNVVQAMLLIDRRPTLVTLRQALENGVDGLVVRAVAAWCDAVAPTWGSQAHEYLARANSLDKRAWAMSRFYRDRIQPNHPNIDLEGLLSMFAHDREHFAKMIASLLPVLAMLTSSELGPLFSPRGDDVEDPRPILDLGRVIGEGNVLYVGLSSLSDAQVGGAIGALLMADLAAVAAERYNYGVGDPVNIFVDEAAEAANVPFTQVLNKGGGAKLRLYVATQTVADFAARLGSQDKATQLLANLNNVIALRVLDERTQEYIIGNLPKTRYRYLMRDQSNSALSAEPVLSSGGQGERLMQEEADLFPQQLLGRLPNLEYLAKLANGRVMKGRIPILVDRRGRS
jgi:conjugal transfer pilus assembly protein TraD